MSELTLRVDRRETRGKNAARRLRALGSLPAVVYGDKLESVAIEVERKVVHRLLKEGGGKNAVFLLELAGTDESRHAMIREMDIDPISRQIRHIDFQRVNLSRRVRVQVHIELVGEPEGVRNEGGVLDFISRDVELECLPTEIPQKLEVDVNELHIGQHVEAKDLELPEGVELLDDGGRVIVAVSHSRVAAELEEMEAEGEEEELLETSLDEPEVIGRGKEDEEEEAAAE